MRTRILNFIIRYCEKHNRHRTIYDRDGVTPYLERYYLLFRDRPTWFPFNITIHKICVSDLPILHDHPWPYAALIIKGGYTEHTLYGKTERKPGNFRVRGAKSYHWLEVGDAPSWSLFFMGKRCREWGFLTEGKWMQHQDYLNWRDTQTADQLAEHQADEEFLALAREVVHETLAKTTPEERRNRSDDTF